MVLELDCGTAQSAISEKHYIYKKCNPFHKKYAQFYLSLIIYDFRKKVNLF